MRNLFTLAAARIVVAFALTLPLAAMANVDYTDTVYEPWSYSAGCVVWRAGSNQAFHESTVADVAADGQIGATYDLGSSGHPWNVFASTVNGNPNSNYTSPGVTLVFDEAGYKASSDAQFAPLSLGGLWVKVLQAENTPYCITDNKSGTTSDRQVELGATGASTYFKFDESFTFDRNSATAVKGTATVEIASGKTFTINERANKGAVVDAGNTLVLTGAGTMAVVGGLSASGTLDLSAATRPTIDGDVTLASDSTIVLPAGTTVDSTTPFAVCTGTLAVGGPVNVTIGTADPVSASLTVTNGGITLIKTTTTYTATISGDTAFSAISWEKGGVAATISDISTAILELSGSGKVTGLSDSPTSIEIASGIVFDMTSVPNVGSIDLKGAGTFLFAANYPATVPAGLHYEYQGGVDSGSSQAIDGVAVRGTLTTTGFVGLTNFEIASGGTYEVASNGYATVSAKAQCKLSGNITIGEGATFVNAKTAGNDAADALNYGAQGCVITVRGTLNMGSTRWSLRSKSYHEIRLYDGAVICGEGQSSYGALDYIESESGAQIDTYGGNVTVSAGIRVRAGANVAFWVADGATNTISGTTVGAGTFSKSGAGTLNLTGTIGNGALALNEGCVNVGSSMDVNIVCNNANGYVTASDNVVVGGTIALANTSFTPNAVLTTFLQDSSAWHGTLSVPAIANNNLNASFLTTYGNSESLIALGGISGASTYIMASGSTTYNVGALRIDGATEFNNGSSQSIVNFAKVTGTNNLTLVGWSGCSEARYNLNKIEGYSGTLTIRNAITRDQGGTFTIGIGNIVTTGSTAPGSCVLPIVNTAVENATGTVVYNLDNAQLNGAAANLEVKSDGIYVAMPSVTINVPKVPNTTVEVSVGGTPVSPATEGESTNTYSVVSGSTVSVTYSSDDYEVTGGSFEFTASEGYTVDATAVTTAAYMASITVGETTTKYATLQAAVTAAAAVNNSKILLIGSADGMVAAIPAPASGGRVQFYIAANGNAEGTVNAPAGDYIMTTASETIEIGNTDYAATKYTVVEAAVAVTINEARTLYAAMYIGDAVSAAIAGGLGSTIEFVNGTDSTPYVSTLEASGFTVENNVWTFTTLPVARVTHGVTETSYLTLAAAFANAQDGDTITVLTNNTLTGTIEITTDNLTLDLNGYTVTGAEGDHIMFEIKAAVGFTIKDTSTGQMGKAYSAESKVVLANSQNCNFALTSGTLESGSGAPVYIFGDGTQYTYGVTISGGKLKSSSAGGSEDNTYCVYATSGTITFTGGAIDSTVGAFRARTVNVSGGDVTVGSEREVCYSDSVGTFTYNFTGGTFNKDVSQYIDDGYEVKSNGDGTYTVRKMWIYAAPGNWNYTGTWSEGATLGEDKVTIESNATYTANSPSDGRMVTLEMELSFDDVNDDDDDLGDAKAAVKLGTGGFKVYTSEGPEGAVTSVWKTAAIEGVNMIPVVNQNYKFLFVLDMTNKTYTISLVLDGVSSSTTNALSVGGITNHQFARQSVETPVQEIEFIGSGKVASIEGSYDTPEGFAKDDTFGEVTLTAAQAQWLNAQDNYDMLRAKIGLMSQTAFDAAHLLNLNILNENSDYTFTVADIGFGVDAQEHETVIVTVRLTRTGALGTINGTLKLMGGNALPASSFNELQSVVFSNADFSGGETATCTFSKGADPAAFYQPVIEMEE